MAEPYRALQPHIDRRVAALACELAPLRARLSARARRALPANVQSELAALERGLCACPESLEALEAYEKDGAAYRRALELALALRMLTRSGRRRRLAAGAALGCGLLGAAASAAFFVGRANGSAERPVSSALGREPVSYICSVTYECATEGRCWNADPSGREQSRTCVARTDADCERPCLSNGGCHVRDGRCRPANDADCAASKACSIAGRCHLRGDGCVVLSDDDCRRSSGCIARGECALSSRGAFCDTPEIDR